MWKIGQKIRTRVNAQIRRSTISAKMLGFQAKTEE